MPLVPTVKLPECEDARLTFGPDAAAVIVVLSAKVSFAVFVSPPPETATLFVTLVGALAETFTVTVIIA
jgi:hypothetical protein